MLSSPVFAADVDALADALAKRMQIQPRDTGRLNSCGGVLVSFWDPQANCLPYDVQGVSSQRATNCGLVFEGKFRRLSFA